MANKSNGHNGHIQKIKRAYQKDKKKLAAASASIANAANDAKERFTDAEESVEQYAKTNPWKAMGLSVLAGVFVAQFFHMHK